MEELADVNDFFNLMKMPKGISPIERLLNEFEAHETKEEESLDQYRKALSSMANPLTRFLMQLIISDEEKHRAVVHAMAATLRGSLTWTRPADSLEPVSDPRATNGKLREATDAFISLEKEGIREYKILSQESNEYYSGLFKVLLDSMIRDSEKHIELLEFLKKSLKDA